MTDTIPSGIDWARVTERLQPSLDHAAIRTQFGGQVVAITGAAGSLGAPLAHAVAAANPSRLLVIDWHESSLFRLRQALAAAHPVVPVDAVLADVRDGARLRRAFAVATPSTLFHLAAYKHVPWGEEDPTAFATVNVAGARAVIEAATAAGVARVVYPSTDKAIDPPSLYGATKRLVEAQFRAAAASGGPACTLVRFVNVLGSQGSAPETFVRLLRTGQAVTVTDPAMRRYWITPAHATLLLLHGACVNDRAVVIAPDAGEEISVVDIGTRLARIVSPGHPPMIRVIGPRPGERLAEPLVAPHESLEEVGLEGILVVKGTTAIDGRAVVAAVTHLETLLAGGATDDEIRRALFTDTWSVP
jgi:O-antigen biosynthesis protein WbqV